MAFREVTVIETKEVLRLWQRGVAKKRIAAQLGVDVRTVRGYLKVAEELGLDPALDLDETTAAVVERLAGANRPPLGHAWEVCTAYADFVRSKLKDGVRLTKVRKLLRGQRQVQVSYVTLYRYAVEELGFGRRAATIPSGRLRSWGGSAARHRLGGLAVRHVWATAAPGWSLDLHGSALAAPFRVPGTSGDDRHRDRSV
jgi:hypothetical protein